MLLIVSLVLMMLGFWSLFRIFDYADYKQEFWQKASMKLLLCIFCMWGMYKCALLIVYLEAKYTYVVDVYKDETVLVGLVNTNGVTYVYANKDGQFSYITQNPKGYYEEKSVLKKDSQFFPDDIGVPRVVTKQTMVKVRESVASWYRKLILGCGITEKGRRYEFYLPTTTVPTQ